MNRMMNDAARPTKERMRFYSKGKMILQSVLGGIAASAGLELFLHPHELIAGGVTGISALVSFYTEKHFGVLLLLFNLPLLFLYSLLGRRPVLLNVLPGLLAFAGSAVLLTPLPAMSGEPVIAALAGGVCLGIGAGLAVKSGGLLDTLGLEENCQVRPIAFMRFNRIFLMKHLFLVCHGAVLIYAGAAMGWERTLYSALACIAAYETSSLILWGSRRSVCVTSYNLEEIRLEIKRRIQLDTETSFPNVDDRDIEPDGLRYTVHVLDIPRFKAVVKRMDPEAKVVFAWRFEVGRKK